MNRISLSSIIIGIFAWSCTANAAELVHGGAILTHNIAAYQHSIVQRAGHAILPTIPGRLGKTKTDISHKKSPSARDLYGKPSEYGTMPMYGEYGDDTGTISLGRSGGDIDDFALTNMWLGVTHYNEYARIDNSHRIGTDYTVSMLGMTGNISPDTQIGAFGGYIDGNIDTINTPITQNALYVGAFGTHQFMGIDTYAILSGGATFNHIAPMIYHDTKNNNLWIGANVGASYTLKLDKDTALVPSVDMGYTGITGTDYHDHTGTEFSNNGLHLLEITPGIQMIRNIGYGWYGTIGGKYTFAFGNDVHAEYNNISAPEFSPRDFSEYGIGIERPMGALNLNIYLNRRDGGRTGWNGGANIQYVF